MRRRFLALALFAATSLFAAETKPSAANYELHGFFGAGANTDISLRNTSTGKSRWYHLGDRLGGILVEKADAKTGTATILVNGERRTLRIAGEGMTESEKEKDARVLRHIQALNDCFTEWGPRIRNAQNEAMEKAGIALLKSHPEYFTEEGSGTPEAKAAILRIAKEGITAGLTVPKKDGTLIHPPENLDALIESVYGDISINLNPSDSKGPVEHAGERTTITTLNGHPKQSNTYREDGTPVSDEHRVRSAFGSINFDHIPRYINDLRVQEFSDELKKKKKALGSAE